MFKKCFRKTCLCGIEINDDELKVVQVKRKSGEYKISSWNKAMIPEGVIKDFEVKDVSKFSDILENTVNNAGGARIRERGAIVSIPEKNIFLRILDVPIASDEEAQEVVKWEFEANIPVSIDEVYYDWQIVERANEKMKVLVVACIKRKIDNIVKVFESTDVKLHVLEADSIANGRSLFVDANLKPALVIDIGLKGTGYFIYYKGYPVFSSSGSISGKFFTDAISKYYKVDWKKAELFKQRSGLGSGQEERREIKKVYGGLLETLIQEIKKTISFYDEKLRTKEGGKVENIVVCGGGSNLNGLTSYLAVNLKRNVVQGDPWAKIVFDGEPPSPSSRDDSSPCSVLAPCSS